VDEADQADEGLADREIRITRVFDASPELVWKAWTEPERIARWWGKRGWNTPVESVTMDVRPGGTFRLNSISEEDGSEMPVEAVYREVVEPERLSFGRPSGDDGPGRGLAIVTLTDLGGGRTEMVFETTIHATEAIHRAATGGLESAFDRLAEDLPTPTPQSRPRSNR